MKSIRLAVAVLVSILPINALRVLGYRFLFGYRIRQARIGFGTVIAVSEAQIDSCRIGPFNLFAGPMSILIEEGASIGSRNTFSCGYWTSQEKYRSAGYARRLEIGRDALITTGHYFDVAGAFRLGARSWAAGVGSQFWTHGAGVRDRDVSIGEDCYLGSAVRFSPGSAVGNHVVVAMGSVVSRKFDGSHALLGGVPAQVLKENYDWKQGDMADAE